MGSGGVHRAIRGGVKMSTRTSSKFTLTGGAGLVDGVKGVLMGNTIYLGTDF